MTSTRSYAPRVLVLGFDAATFLLIEPWVKEGRLPTFAKLINEGVSGLLASTIPYVSGPAWVTFATGKQPGKHGVFDFAIRKPNSYDIRLVNGQDVASDTLWTIASRHQRQLVVFNVPFTYPPQPINGCLVAGMLTPSLASQFTNPEELQNELLDKFPDYILEAAETSPDRARTKEAVARKTHQATHQRLAVTQWLMNKAPHWDLAISVWTETDRIQHYLWDDIDPANPSHEPRLAQRFNGEILKHYQHLDQILQQVLETIVDNNTILFVISDHGSSSVHRFFYPNRWLEQEGYLQLKDKRSRVSQLQVIKRLLKRLGLAHFAKRAFKAFAPSWGATIQLRHTTFSNDVDWHRTRAFWAADNGISINLKGREPFGIVEPGQEYEGLCLELKAKLSELRDPISGERVIKDVHHREEIYTGPWVEQSPDLRLVWQEYPDQNKTYAAAGDLWGPSVFGSSGQTGDHTFHGILIAYGTPIKSGYKIEHAGIVDMAPTILYAMGLPIPQDMDGRILEIFTQEWESEHLPMFSEPPTFKTPASKEHLPEEDKEMVHKRLRDLGYID